MQNEAAMDLAWPTTQVVASKLGRSSRRWAPSPTHYLHQKLRNKAKEKENIGLGHQNLIMIQEIACFLHKLKRSVIWARIVVIGFQEVYREEVPVILLRRCRSVHRTSSHYIRLLLLFSFIFSYLHHTHNFLIHHNQIYSN